MAEPRIVANDVWMAYRRKTRRGLPRWRDKSWALRGVSFTVAAGELMGVVGANGCGKTTLLRTVAGVFQPTRGRVSTRGKVGAMVELRPDADRDLSVGERMLLSGVLLGFRRSDRGYLKELVTGFGGLDPAVLEAPVYTMSTGMLLRLEMSLLLHARCDVLAVDELLVSADAGFRSQCLDRIGQICEHGGAAILSSHDPSLLRGCDRVMRMQRGEFFDPESEDTPSHPVDTGASTTPDRTGELAVAELPAQPFAHG